MTRTAASYVVAMVLLFAVVELSPQDTLLPVETLARVLLLGTLPIGLLVLAPYVMVMLITGNAIAPSESSVLITYAATAVALVGNAALLNQFVLRLAAERERRLPR
ncbi:hypothetical protein [Nostocoides sp. HKS02]|uniref:hypothetical protein n=1 Tax=Nostocoides sp. HKS02 TaxID=1813880 RepID=UPI0012B4F6FD|nr:hypothetical protein [Tetrasphaera sp. HKS02]QGN58679.1 hypothetical protein GKE56_13240 [Tetrasphaera sp. HKS02]